MKHRKTDTAESGRAQSGSLGFEALFLEHWASVHRILQRLVGDPAEAEDLALEAFLRLYRHNQKQPEVQNAGGWLYQVAVRLGLNSIRDWKRREQYELATGHAAVSIYSLFQSFSTDPTPLGFETISSATCPRCRTGRTVQKPRRPRR